MEEILKVEGVTKHFHIGKKKTIHALDHIRLDVRQNEIMGIVGESGSGKSTLGRCIIGLETLDQGEVYFRGERIDRLSKKERGQLHRQMQMVFQNPFSTFNPKLTIGKSLFRLCKYYKMSRKEAEARLDELFAMVNLGSELLGVLPGNLSGGQLQRLAFVRAMIPGPEFIIADEAVSALDISVQAQVLNQMMDLRDQMHISILFISHDLNVVQQVCDRVAVLYLGQIVEMGTIDEVLGDMRHPYTKSLMFSRPKEHPDDASEEFPFRADGVNAVDVGNACRFYARCPYAKDGVCNAGEPEMKHLGGSHWAACALEAEIL